MNASRIDNGGTSIIQTQTGIVHPIITAIGEQTISMVAIGAQNEQGIKQTVKHAKQHDTGIRHGQTHDITPTMVDNIVGQQAVIQITIHSIGQHSNILTINATHTNKQPGTNIGIDMHAMVTNIAIIIHNDSIINIKQITSE